MLNKFATITTILFITSGCASIDKISSLVPSVEDAIISQEKGDVTGDKKVDDVKLSGHKSANGYDKMVVSVEDTANQRNMKIDVGTDGFPKMELVDINKDTVTDLHLTVETKEGDILASYYFSVVNDQLKEIEGPPGD